MPASPRLRARTFQALRYRNYRYLWFGQIAHAFSLWMEQIARPILVLELTGSAFHLGLILAARTAPQLLVGVWAGVIADWYDRRRILLVSKSGAALVNFLLAALVLSGRVELWHVYATTMLKGIFMALDQPARQSLIPSVVPPDQITNAVALNSATMNTMRIVGAAAAGLMLAFVGIGWTFMAVAVIFSSGVYFTTLLSVFHDSRVREKSLRGAISSFKEGVAFAWSTPAIKWIIVLAMVFFAFGMSYMQVFAPLFATQILGIGDQGFGFLMSTTGIGALIGALTLATVNPNHRRGIAIMGVMTLFGIMLILFSLSTYGSPLILSFLVIALIGMFQTPFHALSNSVLLDASPEDMRGRVIALLSLDRVLIMGGGTLAGILATAIGPQSAQIIFGGLIVCCTLLIAVLVPGLRRVN